LGDRTQVEVKFDKELVDKELLDKELLDKELLDKEVESILLGLNENNLQKDIDNFGCFLPSESL